jgi:hypothetical protein
MYREVTSLAMAKKRRKRRNLTQPQLNNRAKEPLPSRSWRNSIIIGIASAAVAILLADFFSSTFSIFEPRLKGVGKPDPPAIDQVNPEGEEARS